MPRHVRPTFALCTALALTGAGLLAQGVVRPGDTPGTYTGPSSSQTPYVEPTSDGWEVVSLISVGDGAQQNGYRMVGIPDGLGALAGKFEGERYVADKAFLTMFMNHELGATSGVVRAHGSAGAFVSQWTVHLNTLQVKWGQDLIDRVFTWDVANGDFVEGTTAFGRFCSADLPAATGFYNPASGKGTPERIFMNGEESGNEGRGFATVVTGAGKGTAYELPYLGKFSWENSVTHPNAGDRTIVVGLDDSTPGQVYVYVGDKQTTGNVVERAGLQDGRLFGVKVPGRPLENAGAINGTFTLENVTAIRTYVDANPTTPGLQCSTPQTGPLPTANQTGTSLQCESVALGITEFARPEDGAWDTQNPNAFYFVTTGASGQTARLYRLTFDSLANPTGGTIQLVVDAANLVGTDGAAARSFDNMTVDTAGRVLIQEDPGNTSYIAKTWQVTPGSPATAVQIFESDRDRFLVPTLPFSVDEESSGIIEVTELVASARWYEPGRRYFLGDMQAHYRITTDPELVEDGQLYLLISPPAPGAPGRR